MTAGRAATWVRRDDRGGPGLRVAVKDLLDEEGEVTTAGCRVLAERAAPAPRDAACLAGVRAAEAAGGARVVGRTVLHELAFGITGVNAWAGTPVNPLDPALLPGGSSSGSAVAVAAGEADVGIGTDTGGSVRIPAACCGVAGLKTTHGRVPVAGVHPLAPSLDTVGPLARDVAGLVAGMRLLEPGFAAAGAGTRRVARLRLPADPAVDAALDRVLAAAGVEAVDVTAALLDGWRQADLDAMTVLGAEAWAVDGALVRADPDGVGEDVRTRLLRGAAVDPGALAAARTRGRAWGARLTAVLDGVGPLALPVLTGDPPRLADPERLYERRATLPVNLAGVPALALPVPRPGRLPTSLQLVGPPGGEELLLATGLALEAAAAAG